MLSTCASGEVMIVLMPCKAADTGRGTELSADLSAVSFSTPVIRKSTVGRMVMLPVEEEKKPQSARLQKNYDQAEKQNKGQAVTIVKD